MDWPKIGEETVELTRGYLRVNTTNPPGGETAGTRFLAQVLNGAGIASETAESAPGRGNLVARVRGDGSLGGIVLHHHIDVVYAEDWKRIHGNDERISVENLQAGARCYTEMLLDMAAA